MEYPAGSFRVDLLRNSRVSIEFECSNQKEAEELYEGLNKACKEGELILFI